MALTEDLRVVRGGRIRLARNCWIAENDAEDLASRCSAVLETSADHSLVGSVTAAQLYGFWLPRLPDEIHVVTATPERRGRSMTRTKRPQFVTHRFQLAEQDQTTLQGVPITTPARTWRDLASVLELPDLVAAGDSVLRSGVPVEELWAVCERTRRAPFARRATVALGLLDARSRSRPESHLRVAVSGAGLPRFQVNEPIYRDEGGWLAEPDLSLPEAKLALEYQGEEHADVRRMRKDITRGVDRRADKWLVYQYGPIEVFRRPWQVRAEVRATIADRAPHLLQGVRRIPRKAAS
jgi:hypothetical protein